LPLHIRTYLNPTILGVHRFHAAEKFLPAFDGKATHLVVWVQKSFHKPDNYEQEILRITYHIFQTNKCCNKLNYDVYLIESKIKLYKVRALLCDMRMGNIGDN
jgi:hypothetical protein